MTEIRARLGVLATAAVAGVAGIGFLLVGCGSSAGTGTAAGGPASSSSAIADMSMSPGMSMAPGESMAPAAAPKVTASPTATPSAAGSASAAAKPSRTALMVCGDDIKDQVRTVMKLAKPAPTLSTFSNHLFTCTYTLPQGKLVLSVKQSATDAAANRYFAGLRATLPTTHPLIGLGEHAYATTTGIAVVIKDDQTLTVDATGMPAVFGSEHQKRTDLAYEIASDVLGCWTGDGDE